MGEAVLDMRDCLARVRQQDEEAAKALVQHLYPLVIKIVRAHLPRRMEEEDLAQMIFLKMFRYIEQYSGTVPFEHWVSRIAVNTCLNQLRSEKCKPELRWADLSEDEAEVLEKITTTSREPDPSEGVASRELVEKLLNLLSPKDRLVITCLDLEDRSVADVRNMTGWSESLIKVRAFRARIKLRKLLAKLMKHR
ncbi:MAG: sigma-70 family RNA polymerase sigma factor [Verrucomicrobiota bacterium]